MLELILNPTFVLVALAVLAVATPLVAFALRGRLAGRVAIVAGASGPFLLVFWGFHNLILAWVGFDQVASAAIVVLTGLIIGAAAGWWLAGAPHRQPDES